MTKKNKFVFGSERLLIRLVSASYYFRTVFEQLTGAKRTCFDLPHKDLYSLLEKYF